MGAGSPPLEPRLLSAPAAAGYLGVGRSTFLRQVGTVWPEPLKIGGRVLWDRRALDAAVDALGENGAASGAPGLALAAGAGERDPILERINRADLRDLVESGPH